MPVTEVIEKVKAGPSSIFSPDGWTELPPFRPSLELEEDLDVSSDVKESETAIRQRDLEALFDLVRRCWMEDPLLRPDFSHIKLDLRRINRQYAGWQCSHFRGITRLQKLGIRQSFGDACGVLLS